ncbi:hypothetical protein PV721_16280 [Streptomyces sp. MB09-01]|uniref:hypothetical protein n=1 Tax=Streptomyces sp. MB09-01 TaxID=3028666 RepID=UPI0029BD5AE1|nr:hypothetical protein [Streptomyces sp. MB09-01]MDX3535897.1 hypothetical protein [Streptomyces sp. MB09-01]
MSPQRRVLSGNLSARVGFGHIRDDRVEQYRHEAQDHHDSRPTDPWNAKWRDSSGTLVKSPTVCGGALRRSPFQPAGCASAVAALGRPVVTRISGAIVIAIGAFLWVERLAG